MYDVRASLRSVNEVGKSQHQNLHPDLHPLLLEFHRINALPLRAVWRVYTEECLNEIILEFDDDCLVVAAEPSDDTIVFHLVPKKDFKSGGSINASHSEPWRGFIGEEFGWGWITINQQDALDGILLSFGGITPQIMLSVMASTIKESIIRQPSEKSG